MGKTTPLAATTPQSLGSGRSSQKCGQRHFPLEEVWCFPKSLWVIWSGAACFAARWPQLLVCLGLRHL